jgi:WD40 repeat protein
MSLDEFSGYWVSDVAVSPDGQVVAAAATAGGGWTGGVWLWDIRHLEYSFASFSQVTRPDAVSFSPDGKYLAIVGCNPEGLDCAEQQFVILDWQERVVQLEFTSSGRFSISQISFSADGHLLVSQGWSNVVSVWDSTTGELLRTFEGMQAYTNGFALSPDGQLVATGASNGIRIWDFQTGQAIRNLEGIRGNFGHGPASVFSTDGEYLAVGDCTSISFEACTSGAIYLINLSTFERDFALFLYGGGVSTLAFSPDGRFLAGGTLSNLYVWSLPTFNPVAIPRIPALVARDLAFTADGSTLVVASQTGLHFMRIPSP